MKRTEAGFGLRKSYPGPGFKNILPSIGLHHGIKSVIPKCEDEE
jgi:hypothetical protein